MPPSEQSVPTNHYLLPYEKYWAARLLRRQAAHSDSKVVRQFQQRWGTEGIVLLAAAQAGIIFGAVLVFLGAAFVIAGGGRGTGLIAFYGMICLAFLALMVSVVRNRQRRRAVKQFQADRRAAGGGPLIEQSS
ncbi:MAG TPA: hypothetical protein VMS00_11415 [Acidimicrobiales bacterium]|nr:hypothetical protein [Acidimicrobiales bacterium]